MSTEEDEFRVTAGLTPQESAELIGRLDRGYKAAYQAAHEAFTKDRDQYEALFATANEVNELAADGLWETYDAGRPAGMPVEEWAARDTEWERQFEAAATAAKDQRLADERAADEEAHERAQRLAGLDERDALDQQPPADPIAHVQQGIRQAGLAGAEAAEEVITRQADAGKGPDEIDRHQGDTAAELLSSATTDDGKAFARSYDITAGILARDLREQDPHPALAARGWQTRTTEIELEAS